MKECIQTHTHNINRKHLFSILIQNLVLASKAGVIIIIEVIKCNKSLFWIRQNMIYFYNYLAEWMPPLTQIVIEHSRSFEILWLMVLFTYFFLCKCHWVLGITSHWRIPSFHAPVSLTWYLFLWWRWCVGTWWDTFCTGMCPWNLIEQLISGFFQMFFLHFKVLPSMSPLYRNF